MGQVDDARLKELIGVFGPDDLKLVVDAFLEEAEQALATLGDLVSDRPDRMREQQLHYLVGAARNLGATELADLCQRHQAPGAGFAAADLEALRACFRLTCAGFSDGMNRVAGDAA